MFGDVVTEHDPPIEAGAAGIVTELKSKLDSGSTSLSDTLTGADA